MQTTAEWIKNVIKQDQIDKYLSNGKDFINDDLIKDQLATAAKKEDDKSLIRDIILKSKSIQRLDPHETAALLHVENEELWEEIYKAAGEIKKSVYDNRIVTFAPLYCSSLCVNNCKYCGFKTDNWNEKRSVLSDEELIRETESLIEGGHKRLIMVYGEHPKSDADYIAHSMETVYGVKKIINGKENYIRRVNINAAPLSIENMKLIKDAGIGTYQVFQETYSHEYYKKYHPATIKANYKWRLYALHRAMDAGIDDVATGALFGLYDWRFEVMGLLYHAIDLEEKFGIGPHTVSFPRLRAAAGSQVENDNQYLVSDSDFKKLVAVLRLSIPYTGMIITAREPEKIRNEIIPIGCTQTDASTRIGVGSYSNRDNDQDIEKQQFMLGDTRSLEDVIRDFAEHGTITSFCTAGYRCGRTGDKIMKLLCTGKEGKFCKLNAVLTFREWLDDYAAEETKAVGYKLIEKEISEINSDPDIQKMNLVKPFHDLYGRICNGERDLYI